ncbi:MAG: branched-chain amino acid ABC transporter permease [Pseudomonadota bacterium]
MLLFSAFISGLGLGSMYGLLALGFYVTYSVSGTVNFSQGSSMMLGAVLCYTFTITLGWGMAAGIGFALVLCALWGAVVERLAVRPFVRGGSNAWLMSTVAIGIILENVALFWYGNEPRGLPSALVRDLVDIAGLGVYPLQLAIPVTGLAIAFALQFLSRRTRHGKAFLAVVQNQDAARLMGINVSRAITASFAVSTVFAGIAGILIAPLFNVSADMGTLFGIKAFAVAILGGITSAWGVMVAGLVYGLVEATVTALLGSPYTQIVTFALVIVALAAMPNGLFGQAGVKKV